MFGHTSQQAERAVDVNIVVIQRFLSALTNRLERSKVDDIVDVWVFREDFVELLFIRYVALIVLGSFA